MPEPTLLATALASRRLPGRLAAACGLALALALFTPLAAQAQDLPTEITGKAILEHPAGKALVEAAKLLKAGKLAELKEGSVREIREEWATISAADQRAEAEELRDRAPEPVELEAAIAHDGVLTFYSETTSLYATSADGKMEIMAFVQLEEGKWRVTGGPYANSNEPVEETAPALVGQEILNHQIGRMALAYAQQIELGDFEGAMEFASEASQAKRKALSAEERQESETFSKSFWPTQAQLEARILQGGRVSFEGENAYLMINTNEQTTDADGTIHSTSTSFSIPFVLEVDTWRVAN